MVEVAIQPSFNGGEWSPALYTRVDQEKYRSAAALLENFFVDYRGGASTRPGSEYVIQAFDSVNDVRIIPFQASYNVGYVVEIGNGYMRFIYHGDPVVETAKTITAATKANPCVVTIPSSGYSAGDWIYISGVVGMTQLNGRYFKVLSVVGNNVTLGMLNGANLDSSGFGTYVSGGTAARLYKIPSPYTSADDLHLIKFAQSVNQLIICHPNYPVYVLSLITATNWTLVPATFGATINPPTGVSVSTTLGGGSWNYAYVVTAVDSSGQESSISSRGTLVAANLRTTAGTNSITWSPVPNAAGYNVYLSNLSNIGAIPLGVQFGFIGYTQGTTFIDSNIGPDFTVSPPISRNPFIGSGIDYVTVTSPGTYTTVPGVSFSGTPSIIPVALAQLSILGVPTISNVGDAFVVGDTITFPGGVVLQVTGVTGTGKITSWAIANPGAINTGSVPTNPVAQISTSGIGHSAQMSATWGVSAVLILNPGAGFSSTPSVIFSAGAAAATAHLAATSNGNPTVPGFAQQRLVLAGAAGAPATFHMSKIGQYFNFDVSAPTVASDSISGTLVSGTLNSIKSIVGSAAGMLILTDKAVWLVSGGSPGSAITPANAVANPQSYIGANDIPPIFANYDLLYVQSEGTAVRDLAYNIYFNTFTGTDISIMSSHLFVNHKILEWCWAQQPFKFVQAVRNDGDLLSMTFIKEQDFIAWSHYNTNGTYTSICSVTEEINNGDNVVDAVYTVVQRNGAKFIERFVERTFPNGYISAWCVDSGLRYSGTPVSTFTGGEHLAGMEVTGLADGEIITPFTMPASGIFTLPSPASVVTVGLAYTCKLKTLPLDVGEPSVQGKLKKITGVDIRVVNTLGLSIGSEFTQLVPMKDLQRGNVSSTLTGQQSQIVTDLVTGDAFTVLNPTYTVPGQYCIQQSLPYPATILGVFPEFVTEDRR